MKYRNIDFFDLCVSRVSPVLNILRDWATTNPTHCFSDYRDARRLLKSFLGCIGLEFIAVACLLLTPPFVMNSQGEVTLLKIGWITSLSLAGFLCIGSAIGMLIFGFLGIFGSANFLTMPENYRSIKVFYTHFNTLDNLCTLDEERLLQFTSSKDRAREIGEKHLYLRARACREAELREYENKKILPSWRVRQKQEFVKLFDALKYFGVLEEDADFAPYFSKAEQSLARERGEMPRTTDELQSQFEASHT